MPPCVSWSLLRRPCLLFIVPDIQGHLQELGGQLPAPTQILVDVCRTSRCSSSRSSSWCSILLAVGFRYFISTPNGRVLWDTTKLKAPDFWAVDAKDRHVPVLLDPVRLARGRRARSWKSLEITREDGRQHGRGQGDGLDNRQCQKG